MPERDNNRSPRSPAFAALAGAGVTIRGAIEPFRETGRAAVSTVDTDRGVVWIKEAYRLPPGEEVVLAILAGRGVAAIPEVIATWPGGVALAPLPGPELAEDAPIEEWCLAARTLGALLAGERAHVADWLERGVRDRRPEAFARAVDELTESAVLAACEAGIRADFIAFVPRWIERFVDAFEAPATLVHQDAGCCNIAIARGDPAAEEEPRAVLFDWSDVVVGHPTFAGDRLLDQVLPEGHSRVIEAFCAPLDLAIEEFAAMRRSNVLHEILRYHDELAYIPAENATHAHLAKAVRSQVKVLVEWQRKQEG